VFVEVESSCEREYLRRSDCQRDRVNERNGVFAKVESVVLGQESVSEGQGERERDSERETDRQTDTR
jgi:hypothetical protein